MSSRSPKKQRYGFRLLWKTVPRDMKRYGIGEVGSFDKDNCHRGVCWGWPKECHLTNLQARTLFFNCYKSEALTLHQLIVVRKSLSFAWELSGGLPGGNYPSVKETWKIVRPEKTATQIHRVLPQRIPSVSELIRAFSKNWSVDHPLSFIEYCTGLVAANDLFIFGLRSTEDVRRVKMSDQHQADWINGWQCTRFKGGRAKLCGVKKNTRPWSIWRTCHCPGLHVRPPAMFTVDKTGQPNSPLTWCSSCPVAVLEFLFSMQWQDKKRCYPKWLASGRFGGSNTKDVAKQAIDWFIAQGVITDDVRYDRNAGRKSLARWCSHLNLAYEDSFQCHGDLPEVWGKNYQIDMAPSEYKGRAQTSDPLRATKALRRFANLLGRGKKIKPKLGRSDRFASDVFSESGKDGSKLPV